MNPSTNCPYCGAEIIVHPFDKNHTVLDCGSVEGWRTPLCREREAHNKTRLELSELKARWPENMAIEYLRDCLKGAEAKNQKLRQEVEELTSTTTSKRSA